MTQRFEVGQTLLRSFLHPCPKAETVLPSYLPMENLDQGADSGGGATFGPE